MSNLSRGDIAALMLAFAVVAGLGGCQKETPKSSPVVEFKPVSCFDAGDLVRCHDAELHVTCYRFSGNTLSCVPDQWTYRDEDEQTKTQK